MALEVKYFELNGINLAQFTYNITDSQEPETGTIPNMGDENRQFAEDDRGLRTIIWEGYVSNDETYLNLRKVLLDNTVKVLKLHPERKITLLSLGFKKRLEVKKTRRQQDDNNNACGGHKGIQHNACVRRGGSNILTGGHPANDRRQCADSTRMDADRYRHYHKTNDKQWSRQDGVERNA
jgi:hypothetical protein